MLPFNDIKVVIPLIAYKYQTSIKMGGLTFDLFRLLNAHCKSI